MDYAGFELKISRRIFNLYFFFKFSVFSIDKIMNITYNTARKRLSEINIIQLRI
jgi:hypothetical protein